MSELRVASFGEAQALANKFNDASENLQELINFCSTIGNDMQGIWEGAAIANFTGDLEETKSALLRMVPVVAELQTEANQKLANIQAANV